MPFAMVKMVQAVAVLGAVAGCTAGFAATVRPDAFTVDGAGVVGVSAGGQVFRARSEVPATVRSAAADRVELELATPDGPVAAVWCKAEDGAPELSLSAPTGRVMKAVFAYPARWETRPGDDVVLPFGEGMSYPVDDPDVVFQQVRAPFSSGMGASMGFFGVRRGGVYFMTGVEKSLDAGLNCRTNIPYAAGVYWRPSNGTWGYDRKLRLFAGSTLGAVASDYRAWREGQGYVRTLAEKAKSNPHLKDFPGTADFWIWDDNNQNRLYNWPWTEPPADLDVRRIAREMKDLGMDRVLWNAFEGLTPGDCAFLKQQGYLTGTYDCLRDVFHPGLLSVANPSSYVRAARFLPFADDVTRVNPDGSFARAWSIPDKSGKMHPMHALCDVLSPDICRRLIAPEVARIGYTSRLMDVQACGGPAPCFSTNHPCTGAEALAALRAEHRYLGDDLDLVVGVEVGNELLLDAYHYAEGLTSLPHPFRKELCWRYKDQALYGDEIPVRTRTLMHNPKYRIPLWELVYHDCAVNYYYWADTTLMYPQLTELKDAYCNLYGLPPIYSMNVSTWNRLKREVAASYRRATPTARKTMFSRMTGFEYLSADRLVQRTTFANGVSVTQDFHELHARSIARAPRGFKILSFNICHGKGMDGKVDLARVAAVVNRSRPRFAALQELDRRTKRVQGVDQPAELGRLTGMVPTFARAIDYQGGEYGVMLLSREAPRAVRKLPLPGKEPRVLLLAEFDDCWVGCTHLSVAAKAEREASVKLIREAVGKLDKPVFLTGDWNARPDSSVLKGLDGFLEVLSETRARTFHGHPANGPSGTTSDFCIDYVAVDDAHAASYRVLERGTVQDRNTSDHAPIYVTVEPLRD